MAHKPSCKERQFRTKKGRCDNDNYNNDNIDSNSLRQNIFQTKKPPCKCKRQVWCSRGGQVQGREHIQALSCWLCATPVSFTWSSRDFAPVWATKRHRATAHKEESVSGDVCCLLACTGACQHQPGALFSQGVATPKDRTVLGPPVPSQKVNPQRCSLCKHQSREPL